ncbi:MAG: glycoside hydrolase family 127 protein [Marinilabiliales bacterium]|nr:glycoside hydrolase family 127 protein [Marinilabiliales bacterium]
MKRISLWILLVLTLQTSLPAATVVPAKVNDQLIPAASVQMTGFIGSRFDDSYNHRILAQDVDKLIAPFLNRTETSCWQTEFWGKWFTSAVLAYRYRPEPRLKTILDEAVQKLSGTQSADGYIGNYADEKHLAAWDIWGRKYCMLGLIAYHELTGDKKVLKVASGIADHLMKELKDRNALIVRLGNHRGMAASSVLEPICLLYVRTGEKRFLDFAEEIVRQWETPDGPQLITRSVSDVASRFPKPSGSWYGWEQGQKAYEMMSCYEGLLELYRITGKPEYRQAVELTWDNILRTEINLAGSGSSVETWFHGADHQAQPVFHYQETCVTATWIKLTQQLLRLTGEAKYGDAIETTFYNALLGAMNFDGSDWAKYTPLEGQRLEGDEQCHMGLNCCVASGPRGLFTLPITAVMADRKGVQVNFFLPGSYVVATPDKQSLTLTQETAYPEQGTVNIRIGLAKAEEMTLSVRIPSWSKTTLLLVNGEEKSVTPGELAVIHRIWKSDDKIELRLDLRGRVVRLGENPSNMAILRGPVLLSRDERLEGPAMEAILTPVTGKDGSFDVQPVAKPGKEIWMEFQAPFMPESYREAGAKPVQVHLCDYASAGNAREGHPVFRVWLPQLYDPRK